MKRTTILLIGPDGEHRKVQASHFLLVRLSEDGGEASIDVSSSDSIVVDELLDAAHECARELSINAN